MKRIFVLVLAVLMLGIVACGGESKNESRVVNHTHRTADVVTVSGNLAEVKLDPAYGDHKQATLFKVVDMKNESHYFGLSGDLTDMLKEGQKIEVNYAVEKLWKLYSNGKMEFIWTYEPYDVRRTYEKVKNADGSFSVEKVDWIDPTWTLTDAEVSVTIFPASGVPKTVTISK